MIREMTAMTNYLKKDYNKDMVYNVGVTIMRITLVLFIITLAAVGYLYSYQPYPLKSEGLQEITVTSLEKHEVVTYHRGEHTNTFYRLKAVNEKTGHNYTQTITQDEYKSLKEGQTYTKPVYLTEEGRFISWAGIEDEKEVTELYYKRFPDAEIISRRILIGLAAAITLISLSVGINFIRKGLYNTRKSNVVKEAVSYDDILKAEHELGHFL